MKPKFVFFATLAFYLLFSVSAPAGKNDIYVIKVADAIGPGVAVAILTTLYGALLANALFLPLAAKLKLYGELESAQKSLIIQGILSIAQGDHPAVVQEKLASFLDPKGRIAIEEAQKKKKGK